MNCLMWTNQEFLVVNDYVKFCNIYHVRKELEILAIFGIVFLLFLSCSSCKVSIAIVHNCKFKLSELFSTTILLYPWWFLRNVNFLLQ